MHKKTTLALACAVLMLIASCAKKNVPATSTTKETPADEAAALKAKYTPEQIAQGKVICQTSCIKCHEFKQPGEFTIHQWNKILPDMIHKSNLGSDQAGMVRAWIITNAKVS